MKKFIVVLLITFSIKSMEYLPESIAKICQNKDKNVRLEYEYRRLQKLFFCAYHVKNKNNDSSDDAVEFLMQRTFNDIKSLGEWYLPYYIKEITKDRNLRKALLIEANNKINSFDQMDKEKNIRLQSFVTQVPKMEDNLPEDISILCIYDFQGDEIVDPTKKHHESKIKEIFDLAQRKNLNINTKLDIKVHQATWDLPYHIYQLSDHFNLTPIHTVGIMIRAKNLLDSVMKENE